MDKNFHFPFYAKASQIIIGLLSFFYILYIGQEIIIPLIFATILAILLNPFVNYLNNKKINRVLSIFISLLFAIIFLGALIYFISSQVSMFSETFPQLKQKLITLQHEGMAWISQTLKVKPAKINSWMTEAESKGINSGALVIGQTLTTITGFLVVVFLLPVYIFLILFYKPLLLDFFRQLFNKDRHQMVAEVLLETKSLIQSYLVGLLLEAFIVAVLNSIGLLILGIEYAILLGIVGALLNIIPYIGGLIAIALPVFIALATKPPIYALYVIVMYMLVQLIDNNVIVPRIVASKVKINAFVSIVVVLIGGALWGVAGMFLSIPLTAIIKVIFDRIDSLKPLGFLLGDNMPPIGKNIFNFGKKVEVPNVLEQGIPKEQEKKP